MGEARKVMSIWERENGKGACSRCGLEKIEPVGERSSQAWDRGDLPRRNSVPRYPQTLLTIKSSVRATMEEDSPFAEIAVSFPSSVDLSLSKCSIAV